MDGTGTLNALNGLRAVLTADSSEGEALAAFAPASLTAQSAAAILEIYRRPDGWRLRAVGQGWTDGLAGLARDYGIAVTE
jgi:stress response protein SCP2